MIEKLDNDPIIIGVGIGRTATDFEITEKMRKRTESKINELIDAMNELEGRKGCLNAECEHCYN